MITRRILCVIYSYLRLTSRVFYAIPFEPIRTGPSRSDFELRMCRDAKSIILFHINFSIQCETMIYSFLRLCQMHVMGKYANISPYVIHCFNMVGFGYPVYLQLYLMFYGEAFCNYFNQTVAYDKELRKKYLKRKSKGFDILETGISAVVPFVYFQGFCFGMYSLMKPTKAFFHCSLLKELEWPIVSQIPVKIYECYMFYNCWHVIVSVWVSLCAPSYSLTKWPAELVETNQLGKSMIKRKTPSENKFKTSDEIRQLPNSVPTYLHLYMLSNRFNAVARYWLVGVSFYTGQLVGIYMGFATFQLAFNPSVPWKEYMAYPTSCLFLGLLFAFASPQAERIHTFSSEFLQQLKDQPHRLFRKSVRYLKPMAVWVCDILYFEMGTGADVVNSIAGEIADLVVGFS